MSQEQPSNGADLPVRPKISHVRKELPRPGRTQLLFEFDMQREVQSREQDDLAYFLPEWYPPSTKPIDSLFPISIADLSLDQRFQGGALFVKTIESGFRTAALRTIVEDEEGLAERLAVYNIDLVLDAEAFLPEDTLLAIKEPILIAASSGGYTIRVDHPSDLVILSPFHNRIPERLLEGLSYSNKTASEWKQEGNQAYSKKDYLSAVTAYSRGLETCKDDTIGIKYDLLRNRAAANIFLGRFENAQADAEAAVVANSSDLDDTSKSLNIKAHERAGHAAYCLGKYAEAEKLYLKALNPLVDSKESKEALKKIAERYQEQSIGNYDFEAMSRSCTKKRNRLDHASFLDRIEVRDAGKHGRGLFATQDILTGELILCEKALCISFPSDPVMHSISILNSEEKRKSEGTKPSLLFNLISKLSRDQQTAREFFNLYDGSTRLSNVEEVDGVVLVDSFRTLSILDRNSIACPATRSSSKEAREEIISGAGYKGTGIWLRTSYINHACTGNAFRSFIGDMIIIRATRDIAKDEEIFMPYMYPNVDNTITQDKFTGIWGFQCDCELCLAEASDPVGAKKRKRVYKEFELLIAKHNQNPPLQRLESLYEKMQTTYDERYFNHKPKLGLIHIGEHIARVQRLTKDWSRVVYVTRRLLNDMGYSIEIPPGDETVIIDRSHALTLVSAIDTALEMAAAYREAEQKVFATRLEAFGKSLWTIIYGTERGWDEVCKSHA